MGVEQFFGDDAVESVLEDHAAQIADLEDSELKRVMALYKRVRHDLRDRLDALPPGTFNAQRMSGVLAQVETGIAQMNGLLTGEMKNIGVKTSELGIDHLIDEIKRFERVFTGAVQPINLDVVSLATESSNFLFNKYETSIEAYSGQTRSIFAQQLASAAVEETSMGEVVGRISQYYSVEEWRLNRLVRTEMMGLYSYAKLNGMQELVKDEIPDLKKTLYHPIDKRTGKDSLWLNVHNLVVPVDEPFVDPSIRGQNGKPATYMAPPNRPNDRAILIPYRESWNS